MAVTTQLVISGNLTRDPERRETSGGKGVTSVSIAQTPRKLNRDSGKWEDGETVYIRGTAWGDLADHIAHSLRKGDKILAVGTLKSSTWKNKEGVEQKTLEFQIEDAGPSLLFANARPVKGDHSYTDQVKRTDSDGWVTVDDDDTPF
jgi:single-strand DNA-binding protein